jgi:hypothetical protein
MADVTKCSGVLPDKTICPMRETCWRHTAPASELQSWFAESPGINIDGEVHCQHYWPQSWARK